MAFRRLMLPTPPPLGANKRGRMLGLRANRDSNLQTKKNSERLMIS